MWSKAIDMVVTLVTLPLVLRSSTGSVMTLIAEASAFETIGDVVEVWPTLRSVSSP